MLNSNSNTSSQLERIAIRVGLNFGAFTCTWSIILPELG